jgi:hypothetical protein
VTRRFSVEVLVTIVAILLSAALLGTIWYFFITSGFQTSLFANVQAGDFYDWQALSILHGRFDVPYQAIQTEALVLGDKLYGYYGPTPALFRLPLELLAPALFGRWSELSVLGAVTMITIYASRLMLLCLGNTAPSNLERLRVGSLFAIFVGLGTTTVFFTSRAYVYHEVTCWSVALALAALYYLSRLSARPQRWDLLKAGICVMLAILARELEGFGALIAMLSTGVAMLAPRGDGQRHDLRRSLALFTTSAAAISLTIGYHIAKFGKPSGLSMLDFIRVGPDRTADLGNALFHLSNIPVNLLAYFSPLEIRFGFPMGGRHYFAAMQMHVRVYGFRRAAC